MSANNQGTDVVHELSPQEKRQREETNQVSHHGRRQFLLASYGNCLTTLDQMMTALETLKTELFLNQENPDPRQEKKPETPTRIDVDHVDQSLQRMTKVARRLRKTGRKLGLDSSLPAEKRGTLSPRASQGIAEDRKKSVRLVKELEGRRVWQ